MNVNSFVIINWMIILISSVLIFFGGLHLLLMKKSKKYRFCIKMIAFGIFGFIFSALIAASFVTANMETSNPWWYLPSLTFMMSCIYFFIGAKKFFDLSET